MSVMTADKPRPRTLLDVFILSLVKQEVNTLYRLKRDAGISIGAARPALNRMQEKFLIETKPQSSSKKKLASSGPERARKKQEFSIIPVSSHAPVQWLENIGNNTPTDTESVARIVALAEANGMTDIGREALKNAIADRRKRATQKPRSSSKSTIATRYRSIMQACESARARAEASALMYVLDDLQ